MNHNERDKSLLHDLRELAHIQPDANAAARAVAHARAAMLSTPACQSPVNRKIELRGVAAVAAAVFVIALFTHWLLPTRSAESFAFGEVQRQVQRTKSVQYAQNRQDRSKDGKIAQQELRKVMILGTHQKREEVKATAVRSQMPLGAKAPDEYVMIFNAHTGKAIDLYPAQKTYAIPHETLGIDAGTGEVHAEKIEAAPDADFYKQIREVPAHKATMLREGEIGGKVTTRFQVVEKVERSGATETWTRTYWVDRHTKLPVRIEISFRSTYPMVAESDWVKESFVFDTAFDEVLFSTDPPDGYRRLATDGSKQSD